MVYLLITIQVITAVYLQIFMAKSSLDFIVVVTHFVSGLVTPVFYYISGNRINKANTALWSTYSLTLMMGVLILFTGTVGIGSVLLSLHIISAFAFLSFALYYTAVDGLSPKLKNAATGGGLLFLVIIIARSWISMESSSSESLSVNNRNFFPSPGNTLTGEYLEVRSLNRSETCGEKGCHTDIYSQWQQSVHRNSSFNNPFYKAAVEYLLLTSDSTTVRWCGSCHDPVMLYSGLMESGPEMDIPEASAGITCEICHSIVDIPDITGNSNYIIDEPLRYPFHYSTGFLKIVNKMLIRLKPESHREQMLNPIHTGEKFCATCHKVSLDVPINHYRWLRGQDEYDAWQKSGVSHNAASSFYQPPKPLDCRNCHMAEVYSKDMGNNKGSVKNHYFPAANTAMPVLPGLKNAEWLNRTSMFLKSNRVSVDIFGIIVDGVLGAPIDKIVHVSPGNEIRFEVVVRTRNIGHAFPGGTIDSNEPWLEINGVDENGTLIFSSGKLQEDNRVEPSAHFFRGVLLDSDGEFILKRNPHEWRTTLYNTSIPPGSADVIHYTWYVPEDFSGEIKMVVKLNYRKFNRSITEFSLDNPIELPIVSMAEDEIILSSEKETKYSENSALRYNDYGIALLRQQNLEAARRAFKKVTILNPQYADGYINLARVLIKEGNFSKAEKHLSKALELVPNYTKAKYFLAIIAKIDGDYTKAIELFQTIRKTHPNDRVLIKNLGLSYYLSEKWNNARDVFIHALQIDPEDAEAHYNLMLIYQKSGRTVLARYHKELYLKYKPDEQAKSISQIARLKFPFANNEAQLVHSHEL